MTIKNVSYVISNPSEGELGKRKHVVTSSLGVPKKFAKFTPMP